MKAWLLLSAAAVGAQTPVVSGDAELTGVVGGKPLVIRTTSRLAGAIDSVAYPSHLRLVNAPNSMACTR